MHIGYWECHRRPHNIDSEAIFVFNSNRLLDATPPTTRRVLGCCLVHCKTSYFAYIYVYRGPPSLYVGRPDVENVANAFFRASDELLLVVAIPQEQLAKP